MPRLDFGKFHYLGNRVNRVLSGGTGVSAFMECRDPRARWKVEAADKEDL